MKEVPAPSRPRRVFLRGCRCICGRASFVQLTDFVHHVASEFAAADEPATRSTSSANAASRALATKRDVRQGLSLEIDYPGRQQPVIAVREATSP